MQDINVILIQSDLKWADPKKNIENFNKQINAISDKTDIVLLPEMFSTGFNMKPQSCFETMEGHTLEWMKTKALQLDCVICGSLLIKENDNFVNRLIWMRPDGTFTYYDKKHLFSLAGENKVFISGKERVIVSLYGVRFLLQICYDLRFPVWSRNKYLNGYYDYDGIIYVANWPESRRMVWKTLLMARAIENQAFVIGVNRIGKDINGTNHAGDSAVISPKGLVICEAQAAEACMISAKLNFDELSDYRKTFLNAPDWDNFELIN